MVKSPRYRTSLALLVALALAGCGNAPQVTPVSGVVTLDGKPLAGAAITFNPVAGGRPGSGTSNTQGRFEITTFEEGDGALVGEHVVTVTLEEQVTTGGDKNALDEMPAARAIEIKSRVPKVYTSRKTSPLRVKVGEVDPEVRFELKSEAE